jgi:alanine racemase
MRELVIDLDAIAANLATLRERFAPTDPDGVKIAGAKGPMALAVVKANAYGHGMIEVAKTLAAAGVDYLGVADIEEALSLRAAGIRLPILAWLHSPAEDFVEAVNAEIDLGIANTEQLNRVAQAARQTGRTARVHLKIDTGLGRNGSTLADWGSLIRLAKLFADDSLIEVVAVFSHLSSTSEEDDLRQIEKFNLAVEQARSGGLDFSIRHLTASDGSISYPQAHFEMVRLGVALYGLSPFADHHGDEYGLRPAMTASSVVVQTKRVGAGEGVSYGYLHRTAGETTLALVPIGYAEGLPRVLPGVAEVTIGGSRFPINSRVAMDQFVLDVGNANVEIGDRVVLFGDPATGAPSVDELAAAAGTINYEIVTRMGGRFKRSYLGGKQ